MSKLLRIETNKHIPFVVRIVESGDKYGHNDSLVYDDRRRTRGDALVEFYDARYNHTKYGQFVSRYYRSTLLRQRGRGLFLNEAAEAWQIDAETMADIRQWLLSH
jgi:hypothetical protein